MDQPYSIIHQEKFPKGDEDIATPDEIKDWKYLQRIADKIIQGKYISIGLLIGVNCSKALGPLEVFPSKDGSPYAVRTLLGWCIVGPIGETASSTTVSCNRISIQDMASKSVASHYFAMETEVKDVEIKQMFHRIYTADFNNHCPSKKGENITSMQQQKISVEHFMTLMEKECSKEEKHYELPLPLRVHDEMFPDNRSMAEAKTKRP